MVSSTLRQDKVEVELNRKRARRRFDRTSVNIDLNLHKNKYKQGAIYVKKYENIKRWLKKQWKHLTNFFAILKKCKNKFDYRDVQSGSIRVKVLSHFLLLLLHACYCFRCF